MKRTHTCGELTEKTVGQSVLLEGWVATTRCHGGILFVDIRDRYGFTQVVFDPAHKSLLEEAGKLRREDVISIKGKVRKRPDGTTNPKMTTGHIEVLASFLEVLSKADVPPIEIDDRVNVNEDVRLKYRYLDLRKPSMQHNLMVRHKTCQVARQYFDKLGFLEIETPMLAKSTPEGARDYIVPSRVNPGKFYALPQSPQLFKQLLMVSGCDRYFQIVKCFRDEDLRADRQPEFTQIDVEMSFVDEEDIYSTMEGLMKEIWHRVLGVEIKIPFRRMTYEEAMSKYGSDKPDLRFGLEIVDMTGIAKKMDFEVFKKVIVDGGCVKALNVPDGAKFSRKDIDQIQRKAQEHGAKGLLYLKIGDEVEGVLAKFVDDKIKKELLDKTKSKKGDLILIIADHKHHNANVALGAVRLDVAEKLNLIDKKQFNFCWIVDFPLLEFDEDEQRHVAVHHPFTSPKTEDLHLLESDPGRVRSKAYDLTLNGVELGGGSIRIHRRDVQSKIFSLLGISEKEAQEKFGFLLEAFRYGAPPHGGIAFGLDRVVAILTGNVSIREVIAFPKTKDAESLMDGCPSEVAEKQLKELHIKLDIVKKEKEEK